MSTLKWWENLFLSFWKHIHHSWSKHLIPCYFTRTAFSLCVLSVFSSLSYILVCMSFFFHLYLVLLFSFLWLNTHTRGRLTIHNQSQLQHVDISLECFRSLSFHNIIIVEPILLSLLNYQLGNISWCHITLFLSYSICAQFCFIFSMFAGFFLRLVDSILSVMCLLAFFFHLEIIWN